MPDSRLIPAALSVPTVRHTKGREAIDYAGSWMKAAVNAGANTQ